jgi:hypothetical protein
MDCEHDWTCGLFVEVEGIIKIDTICDKCKQPFLADFNKIKSLKGDNERIQEELKKMKRRK